jgi:hypothetical protein
MFLFLFLCFFFLFSFLSFLDYALVLFLVVLFLGRKTKFLLNWSARNKRNCFTAFCFVEHLENTFLDFGLYTL